MLSARSPRRGSANDESVQGIRHVPDSIAHGACRVASCARTVAADAASVVFDVDRIMYAPEPLNVASSALSSTCFVPDCDIDTESSIELT